MRVLSIKLNNGSSETLFGIDLFSLSNGQEYSETGVPSICFSIKEPNENSERVAIKSFIVSLLKLLMLSNELHYEKSKESYSLLKTVYYLNFVRTSIFYPYKFDICVHSGYSDPSDEESRSRNIAVIHRLAKSNVRILEPTRESREFAKITIPVQVQAKNNQSTENGLESIIAAIATTGFLSSEARIGYYLSILNAQSLVALLSKANGKTEHEESILQGFSSLTSYIYTVYHRRLFGKIPELYRHIIPEPPSVDLPWEVLYNELYFNLKDCFHGGCSIGGDFESTLDSILLISNIIENTINDLLERKDEKHRIRQEVVLGRFRDYNRIRGTVERGGFNLAVMVATEQWSPLHSLIGRLAVRDGDNGHLLVLYTQSSLTSTITTLLIEEMAKLAGAGVGSGYVPVSVTDAFVAENVGRLIDKYINELYQGNSGVKGLVLATGPSALSVPLYMYGKSRELDGWSSFLF